MNLKAQQENGGPGEKVTNTETTNAPFLLEDSRVLPFTLVPHISGKHNYDHSFNFLPIWNDKQVFVRFDEISASYSLKINSFDFGIGSGNRIPTEFNLTPFLKKGPNTIQLEFDPSPDSLMENSLRSGLLIIRDAVHLRDILVTNYSKNESGYLVRVRLFIQSFLTARNKGRTLTMTISDSKGTIQTSHTKSLNFPLAFRQEVEVTFDHTLKEAMLWSPNNPALYTVKVNMVEKGQLQSELVWTTFGIRNAAFKDSMLVINLDTLLLKVIDYPVHFHHFNQSDQEVLSLLEEKGYNAVQTNLPIPSHLMDLFDRQGIVVLRKDRDPDLDRSDVNRPSVVWIE